MRTRSAPWEVTHNETSTCLYCLYPVIHRDSGGGRCSRCQRRWRMGWKQGPCPFKAAFGPDWFPQMSEWGP